MVATRAPSPPAPGALEPTRAVRFSSSGGVELYGELYLHAAPRAVALVVHGYAEHCGRYREVANVLVQAGLSVLAVDLRGHGRSQGPRGHIQRFGEYLDDVDAALAVLDRDVPGQLPILLVCHSHGGLVGLRLLADPWRCPKRITAAVLSSPFLRLRMRVSPAKRAAARAVGWLMPSFSLPSDIDIETLTHDAGKLAERRVDTLCHDVAGARWFNEAQEAQAWVREFVHRVAVPTLWLVAGDDALVDPAATKDVHDRLRVRADWHLLEGLYHEVFNETDRARAFAILRTFVDEMFPL